MMMNYHFTDNEEPTDEQLHLLMKEVAVDVTKNAQKTEKEFYFQLSELVKKVMKEHNLNKQNE